MRTLILLIPLMLSIMLVQLGVGALAPLDALAADEKGFSKLEIGLLGSAHFVGFFIGCLLGPTLIGRTGHSRAFAASAAIGVISTLIHPLYINPEVWMLCRVGAGLAMAIGYTVVESWFYAKTDGHPSGGLLSTYKLFDLTGAIGSQFLLTQLPIDVTLTYSYIMVAMLAAASLLPLSLTTSPPPEAPKRPRIRVWRAIKVSPLAAAGALTAGLGMSAFRMLGPLYAVEFALSRTEVAYFLMAGLLGGAISQPIAGWISDRISRRAVLIGISGAATIICGVLAMGVTPADPISLAISSALFGAAAVPLYAICAAHANDFAPKDFVVELNASLLLVFAIGAILSPTVAAWLIEQFGSDALWAFIGAAHLALLLFGVIRAMARPVLPADERTPFRARLRSSMLFGRLLKKRVSPEAPAALPTTDKEA